MYIVIGMDIKALLYSYCSHLFFSELTVQLHQRIVRLAESHINAGLRELAPPSTSVSPIRSPTSSSDVLHVVQTTSTAVVFWATAVKSESGSCVFVVWCNALYLLSCSCMHAL